MGSSLRQTNFSKYMANSTYFYSYNNLTERTFVDSLEFDAVGTEGAHVVVIDAPPEHPALVDGLNIGSVYECDPSDVSYYRERWNPERYNFEKFAETLAKMLTRNERWEGGSLVQFCESLSDMVAAHSGSVRGRGHYPPFWELLRYAYRVFPFGPAACQRTVRDFDAWDAQARLLDDTVFYEFYRSMRECFANAGETGAVIYGSSWYNADGTKFVEPRLGRPV